MTKNELIELLVDALVEAQNHLDYCGYGDSWERECAIGDGLPKRLEEAITAGNKYLKETENDRAASEK